MTRDDFNRSMEKILVFYQRPRSESEVEDFKLYMDGLFSALYQMETPLFEATCSELVKTLARGQKPMPSQFWAVYHRLSVERATSVKTGPAKMTREETHAWLYQEALGLSVSGAELVLELALKADLHFPSDVLQILIDKVAEKENLPNSKSP